MTVKTLLDHMKNLGRTSSKKYFKPSLSQDKKICAFLIRLCTISLTSWYIIFEKAFNSFFRRKNNEVYRKKIKCIIKCSTFYLLTAALFIVLFFCINCLINSFKTQTQIPDPELFYKKPAAEALLIFIEKHKR